VDSGQESARDKGDDHEIGNVVRFPRDWIGPTEDLIPFGPAADRHAAATASSSTAAPELPSASDFWGEHAAAMHSVLEDPGGTPRAAEDAQVSEFRESSAGAVGEPVTATTPLDETRTDPLRTLPRIERPRIAAVARATAIAAAAAGVIALAIGFLSEGGAQRARASDEASVGFLASTGRRLGTSDGIVSAVRHERMFVASPPRPRVPRRTAESKRRSPTHVGPASPAAPSVAVDLTAPTTSSVSAGTVSPSVGTSSTSGGGGTEVSSSPTSSARTTSSGTTSSGSAGSGSGSSSGSPSGPVGPGAPFGPGHLG
jgi:hypothetical protein